MNSLYSASGCFKQWLFFFSNCSFHPVSVRIYFRIYLRISINMPIRHASERRKCFKSPPMARKQINYKKYRFSSTGSLRYRAIFTRNNSFSPGSRISWIIIRFRQVMRGVHV